MAAWVRHRQRICGGFARACFSSMFFPTEIQDLAMHLLRDQGLPKGFKKMMLSTQESL
jgi:hypothetical protein